MADPVGERPAPPWKAGTGPSTAVVAAKVSEGIIRAIDPCTFGFQLRYAARLVDSVLHHIGAMRQEVEWTGYSYPSLPGYLHYGRAEGWPDMRDITQPSGVWLWKWAIPPGPQSELGVTQLDGVFIGPLAPEARRAR